MKKKIGTILEEDILVEAKDRAAREGRPLADLLQESLVVYLHGDAARGDRARACRLFCSHRSRLDLEQINELLEEDALAI